MGLFPFIVRRITRRIQSDFIPRCKCARGEINAVGALRTSTKNASHCLALTIDLTTETNNTPRACAANFTAQ